MRWEEVKRTSWQKILESFLYGGEKDPFYTLFQKILQIFLENYQMFLIVIAVIFMTALGNFVLKNTTRISHAVLAFMIYMGYFYGFFSITGMRQTLATALLLISYEYVKKQKLIPFVLLVLTGALFHITALVFLPLYFVAKIENSKFVFGSAIFGFPFFMIFKNQLAILFLKYSTLEDRFEAYASQYHLGGSFVLTAFQVFLAIYALILIKKVLKLGHKTYIMYNTFALALFFLPLQWVNPSAGRIAQYFAIIIMVWIPYLIDATAGESEKTRKILYTLAIIGFFFITLFSIQGIDEYKFFWQEMELPKDYLGRI
jgi:transmembrane protein EpsG